VDYLFDWEARSGQCRFCGGDYWDMYHYGKKVKEAGGPTFDIEKINALFDRQAEIEAGQLSLFEVAYQELGMEEEHARAALDYHNRMLEEGEEEDEIWYPAVMFQYRDDGDKFHYFLDAEASGSVPDDMVEGLWCPNCGQYGVQFWTSVYGF
jgi:hypothetical protein